MKVMVTGRGDNELVRVLSPVGPCELVVINGGRMCTSTLNVYERVVRDVFSGGASPYPYSSFGTPASWPAGYGFGP
jgi:hypothetical protein